MEKFKKAFRRLPDPRADKRTARVAGGFVHCSCGDTVWRRRAPRTWPRLGNPRKGCCGWSCSCSTGCPATILSAGSSACWTRRRSRPHSAGSWQASPRPTGLELRGVVAVDGKALRGAFERGRQEHPAAHGQRLGSGGANVLGSAQSSRPQRGSGGVGSPGPAGPRRLYRYRGCTALPSRLCLHGARAGCGLRAGAQGEPEQVVRCGRSALCAQRQARSVAERREPATHDRCEWRRATVLRDTTFAAVQKFPGVVALARITSRRRVLGACAEPPQVRYFLLSKYIPAKQLLQHRALPLGDREPAALGTRCRLQRGSQPNSQRQRAREPCYPPKARPQSGPLVTPRPRPCARKSNARGGTTPSSWACSVICDSPAHKGGGSRPPLPHKCARSQKTSGLAECK